MILSLVMIKKIHHAAYRCKNSEKTRQFYEDFLGLPLVGAFEIKETQTGRKTSVLHSFYRIQDGSHIAFFEAPNQPFDFIKQHDFDLHIALEVSEGTLSKMLEKGKGCNVESRGISNHGFILSAYFRDPNGYVVELAALNSSNQACENSNNKGAHKVLKEWSKRQDIL